MNDHHLEVIVKVDGETVGGVDRVVDRFSIDMWQGFIDESVADDPLVRRVPSGEHSISIDWHDGKSPTPPRDNP